MEIFALNSMHNVIWQRPTLRIQHESAIEISGNHFETAHGSLCHCLTSSDPHFFFHSEDSVESVQKPAEASDENTKQKRVSDTTLWCTIMWQITPH